MATIDIYNLNGAKVGTMDLADEVFGAVNEDLLWEAVKHYRAAQRARIGSIRSPLWRHGGTVHGPQPRSYDYTFPKKKLMGALRSALASKLADGKLTVVNAFDLKEVKTKAFREALDKLKIEKTVLLVEVPRHGNRNLELSARNIAGTELIESNGVHPYHLLRYEHVIFTQPAIEHKPKSDEGEKKTARVPRRRTRHEKAAEVA